MGRATATAIDGVSRLISLTHDLAGTANDLTITMAYSPASQIANETRSNDAYADTAAHNENTSTASNGLNEIATCGGASYAYDANGNLTGDGTSSSSYDALNRLSSSAVSGSPTTSIAKTP